MAPPPSMSMMYETGVADGFAMNAAGTANPVPKEIDSSLPLPAINGGLWLNTSVVAVAYGHNALKQVPDLLARLPIPADAPLMVVTGRTLSKSPLLQTVTALLGKRFCGVFTDIGEHAPIENIEAGIAAIEKCGAKGVIGFGGGSVVDACKAISYFWHEKHGEWMPQLAIPTTLSAAEFSIIGGYTDRTSTKVAAIDVQISPKIVVMDPAMTVATPERLWLSTGMRAVDHCCENLYRPSTTIVHRTSALAGLRALFTYLPLSKEFPDNLEYRGALQVACWQALTTGQFALSMGPSHALGHRLGASAHIPHGFTTCLTLGPVINLIHETNVLTPLDRQYIDIAVATSLPDKYKPKGSEKLPGPVVLSRAVKQLIADLGLTCKLTDWNFDKSQVRKYAQLGIMELQQWGWQADRIPPEDAIVKMIESECL